MHFAARIKKRPRRGALHLEHLEPRILLNGVAAEMHRGARNDLDSNGAWDAADEQDGEDWTVYRDAQDTGTYPFTDSPVGTPTLEEDGLGWMMPDAFHPPPEAELESSALRSPPPSGQAPYGADFRDTSEFMIGDVWVTVVLLESNGAIDMETEDWTPSEINLVKTEITEGLTWWEDTFHSYPAVSPLHDLTFSVDFTYADNPVQTGYEPISRPSTDEGLWIDHFLDLVGYNSASSIWTDLHQWNHDQRGAHGAHWAYTVFVADSSADADGKFTDSYFAYAYLGGPFTVMTYDNNGWGISSMGAVIAHETGHIFYALDEYPGSDSYYDHSGYYNTQNLNAYDSHPAPGSRVDSIMAETSKQNAAWAAHVTSPTSSYMLGWQDLDADGVFDVLDVPLTLTGAGSYNSGLDRYEFTGSSSVQTLGNLNPNEQGHDITTNTVDRLQYRLDGAGWVDGNLYGSYTASVGQNVPVASGGWHTIEFRRIFEETGITSGVWSDSFFIQTQSQLPGRPDLLPATDTGRYHDDNLTRLDNSSPVEALQFVVGSTVPGATVTIYSDGVPIGSAVAGGTNTLITTSGSYDLADGGHSLTARQIEPGMVGSGDSPALSISIDTLAPSAPGALDLHSTSDTGASDGDDITKDSTPTFSVTASPYYRARRNGTQISGNYEAGSTYTAGIQSDGTNDYAVAAVDAAGNESPLSDALTVTIDTQAPSKPPAPDLQDGSDTGVSNTDNITGDNTPTFGVTAAPYFRVRRNGTQISGSYEVGSTYAAGLESDGAYDYTVAAVDVAGNESELSDALTTTIDTQAPSEPLVPDLQAASDGGIHNDDNITNVTTPTLGVMIGPDEYFRVYRGGQLVSAAPVLGDDGSVYREGSSEQLSEQPEGAWNYTVSAVDAAGNESGGSAALGVEIDTTAPDPPPAAPDLQAASDSGILNDDNITNVISPVFGVLSADDYFRFYRGTTRISGDYESGTSFTAVSEPEGTWNYTVRAADVAGNESADSPGLGVTLDITAPLVPDGPDLQATSDSGVSDSDNTTNDRTPTLDLSGFESYWRLERNGGQVSGDYEDALSFTDGPLTDDSYSYALYALDAAGNTSAGSDVLEVAIDTVAPAGPPAPDLQPASDTGVPDNDVTADRTPSFDVVVPDDLSFRLYRDGELASEAPILGDDGNVYRTGNSEELTEQPVGKFQYTGTLVDAVGNESLHSDFLEVTITEFWPIGWHEYDDGVFVTVYDIDPDGSLTDPDIAWYRSEFTRGETDVLVDPGRTGDMIINSITLYGDGTRTADLGVVVEHSIGLSRLSDRRTGTPPLGFLVSEGYVGSVSLKTGVQGCDLDDFTAEGGWSLPDGIDGDNIGIYSGGDLRSLVAKDDVNGDIVVAGDLKSLSITGGSLNRDLILIGSDLGKVSIKGGDLDGAIHVTGTIGSISVSSQKDKATGDMVGGSVTANGVITIEGSDPKKGLSLKSLSTKGDFLGSLDAAGGVAKLSIKGGDLVGAVTVTGSVGNISVRRQRNRGTGLYVGGSVTQSAVIDIGGIDSRGRSLKSFTINGGDFGGLVDVTGDLSNFNVRSSRGEGGDLDGTILVGGTIGSISVSSQKDKATGDMIGGAVTANTTITIEGSDPKKGLSLKSLSTKSDFLGTLEAVGGVSKLSVTGGDFAGLVDVGGDLSSFSVKGGKTGGGDLLAGARIRSGGLLKKLSVSGSLSGQGGDLVQIYAGSMGNVSVKGNIDNSRILAGAHLGDDWALGGTGDNADVFGAGSINKFSVKGNVEDSLIGAGLNSLDLEDRPFYADSRIKSVSIKGALTSSGGAGEFGIGSYQIDRVKLGEGSQDSLVVCE